MQSSVQYSVNFVDIYLDFLITEDNFKPCILVLSNALYLKPISDEIVSEYNQEIPQSQTADNPMAPHGRAAQPSRDTSKTN